MLKQLGESMDDKLLIDRTDRICTISINRPEKRNALSPLVLLELTNVLSRLKDENEVRCVIIRGSGEKAFSSGFDISDLPIDVSSEISEPERGDTPLDKGMKAIINFPYPMIAMINGLAYGAGCELAVSCDIRIAAEDVRFSMPPAKLGIVYRWIGILKFIDIVGPAYAKEMFFTGRPYDAHQAKEMGLVHYVLPRDQLSAFVYGMAQEISENAPLSLKAMKTVFNRFCHEQRISLEDAREIETLRYAAFRSEDVKEGRSAFREKRKPVFKGR
jgi:enoyl-CoA hydratase/carnithine racemase